MTGINHMATGAIIGAAINSPIIAMPVAFLSHFLLDILPHYGNDHNSKRFRILIAADAILVVFIVLGLLIAQPHKWLSMLVCGLLAMSPDLMWLPEFVRALRKKEAKARNQLMHLHQRIQWGERVWGMAVEAVWMLLLIPLYFAAIS